MKWLYLKLKRKDLGYEIGMAEHLSVLMAQIARVEDALLDVQFEQHWLHSQTTRQAQGM